MIENQLESFAVDLHCRVLQVLGLVPDMMLINLLIVPCEIDDATYERYRGATYLILI